MSTKKNESSEKVQSRTEPDFLNGEVVKLQSGTQINGAFGEISQKQTTANGKFIVEGVFYE